jgi:predicted AlkP superfamily phosphohydrolase/phosphomutase
MKFGFFTSKKRRFLYFFLGPLWGALILSIILAFKGAVSSYISIFSLDTFLFLVYNFAFYFFPFLGIGLIFLLIIRLIEKIITNKFSKPVLLSISTSFFIVLDAFILFNPWLHTYLLVRYRSLVRIGIFLDVLIIIILFCLWFSIGWCLIKLIKICHSHKTYLVLLFVSIIVCIGIYILILASSTPRMHEINGIDFKTINISPPSKVEKNKILFIGIDGATFDVIRPLIKEGKLPHLKKIMENGCWGELSTLNPTWTPVIWTSIATGKLPNKHGINFFSKSYLKGMNHPIHFRKIPQFVGTNKMFTLLEILGLLHTSPTSSLDRKVPALWNIFSIAGLKVGLIRYPVTWPAEKVNGILISDRFEYSPLEHRFYPSEIQEIVGSVQIEPQLQNHDLIKKYPEIRKYFISDKITEELSIRLMKNIDFNLFIIYLTGTDAVGHLYWKYYQPESMVYKPSKPEIEKYKDLIPDYYDYMDNMIGRIIAQAKGYTIIIASDHGMEAQPRLLLGSYMGMPSGNHNLKQPGILLLTGSSIHRGLKLNKISVTDLAPTILALAGLPVAKDMDGRIISEAFDSKYLVDMEFESIPTYGKRSIKLSEQDKRSAVDRALIEKLKSLGYIH